jgi:hypothetical protein
MLGFALTLALVVVAASCRHEEERAGSVALERAGLAFTRYTSAEQSSVWVADADGSHARRVVTPAYSPFGDRVNAAHFDGGEPRLLLRNATEASWPG